MVFRTFITVTNGILRLHGASTSDGALTEASIACLTAHKQDDGYYRLSAGPIFDSCGDVVEEPVESGSGVVEAWQLIKPYRLGLVLVRNSKGFFVRDEDTRRRDKVRVAAYWMSLARLWMKSKKTIQADKSIIFFQDSHDNRSGELFRANIPSSDFSI